MGTGVLFNAEGQLRRSGSVSGHQLSGSTTHQARNLNYVEV